MIYLIGGPPKCGKTTLAKQLSNNLNVPWVSTDTLQSVIKPYIDVNDFKNKFPSSEQRAKNNDEKYSLYSSKQITDAYRGQAKTVYDAIDMFALCEITDGHDYIIEGYHVEPELVDKLNKKYPNRIKSIFLIKSDQEKFILDIKKSSTPNDWIIERTHKSTTYGKIAKMICEYGIIFQKEAEKYNLKVCNMDNNFKEKIKEIIKRI